MSEPFSAGLSTANILAPVPETLLALAPLRLLNYRTVRYIGDDHYIRLTDATERDQASLRRLYDALTDLLLLITDETSDDARRWQALTGWIRQHDLDTLIDETRKLGTETSAPGPSEALAKAMHDVRGGALSALLGRLQMLDHLPRNEDNLQALFVLARDHHKIMRSAVLGLDDRRRSEDHRPKSHDMQLMIKKWHESVVGPKQQERPIRMFIDCRHEGAASECCLESAALDRIFYNLANNAARHCAGERLDMAIFPLPSASGGCLRFVLSNPVSEADATALRAMQNAAGGTDTHAGAGLNLETLFTPKVSSTGSGFGLTVVADFVAGAFGLPNRQKALRGRYVGAVLDGDTFRVWFHWPIANSSLPQKLDDYHKPKESFSGS